MHGGQAGVVQPAIQAIEYAARGLGTTKLVDEPHWLENAKEQSPTHAPIVRLVEVMPNAVIHHALEVTR
jgi:hypothetical protein